VGRFSQKEEPREIRRSKVFRPFFLAIIFAAVFWGFWTNSQRRIESIAMQGIFKDKVKAFSAEQKAEVLQYLKTFKKNFGIPLEVNILSRPPAVSGNDTTRIYLDVVPSQGRAYLHLPPLVRNAVGKDFIRDMEISFAQDFAAGNWRVNLVSAILALRMKLAEVTK
jgi:hypothetical protein